MLHKIKDIDFETIYLLLSNTAYKNSPEIIKFAKGKNKLPVTFKETFKKLKLIYNVR